VAKFPNIAPVLGVIEYQGNDGNNMTLALLQGYIENQGDGWNYTLDYLGRFLEECRTAAMPLEPVAQAHSAYLVMIGTLGQRTGELHNALSKTTGNSAFDPEPITDTDLADWVLQVQAETMATLDQLEHRMAGLPKAVQETAKNLLAQRKALADRLNACISGQVDAVKTRYHGDYHLGQVLITQNDFVITDFEGEPARPFAERRRKHSPLRDVAGMLRSFNYAVGTALAHVGAERPADLAKFEPWVRDWEAEVGRFFLTAYDEAVHGSGLLATDASLRGLLDLFLLEKALYEVRYELDDRPDWVAIPLYGILSLLQPAVQ
jgi:maltose alpha-D-glucosyltransferase / alpha-amylase